MKTTYYELPDGARFEPMQRTLGSAGPWVKLTDKRYEHETMTTPEKIKVGFRVYVNFPVIKLESN
jgi:hypothetical protein